MQEPIKVHWAFDPVHCNIRFVARHLFLSEIEGAFLCFTGSVASDDETFTNAAIFLEIEVSSIKTNSDIRDNNLRSDNFFNAVRFPKITFQSDLLQKVVGSQYKLLGDLTIRDVTKTIAFDVQQNGVIVDPNGKIKAGFQIRGSLNRFDYNINFNRVINGIIDVGSEIIIICNIELFKQETQPERIV